MFKLRNVILWTFMFFSGSWLYAANPDGDLRLDVVSAYNFVVDSNSPESGPSSAYVGVEVCNDGANDLTNVIVNIGDYDPATMTGTAGTYPSTTVSYSSYSGTFALEHVGDCDGTDASRSIGALAAGECITQYFLLKYPVVDASGNSTAGANTISDDLKGNVLIKAEYPVNLEWNTIQLDLNDLAAGVYLIHVEGVRNPGKLILVN